MVAAAVLLAALSLLLSRPVASQRIAPGGTISTDLLAVGDLESRPELWERLQDERRAPPNNANPDYFSPSAAGGRAGEAGEDGLAVFVARVHSNGDPTHFETVDAPPLELRAGFFRPADANVVQEYVVPGDKNRRPYEQEVTVKLWGAGGGGCDGGRGETTQSLPVEGPEGAIYFGEGAGGGYAEATFLLPVGETLHVVVGGGGGSNGSQSHSLGGEGGYNGGHPGKDDETSGGGGGGGMTTVSWSNGTVIAAAFGGDGGGNTSYCTALGGLGASLRGHPRDAGGFVNLDLAVSDDHPKERAVCPGVPAIADLSHDFATLSWDAGTRPPSKEMYVQRYEVSRSEGSYDNGAVVCSGEYKLHSHVRRSVDVSQNATTSIGDLHPATPYCVRIEAFSVEGLQLGAQILPFTTKVAPVNEWVPVTVGQAEAADAFEAGANGDELTSLCEDTTSRPTGRRGHSMTVNPNGEVYLFGGATGQCRCEVDPSTKERHCASKNVYSNELWHYDPLASMFARLERASEAEPWPQGREQHSATQLPNGDIIVIGGMTSADEDNLEIGGGSVLLADVWRMRDPHQISSLVFPTSEEASEEVPPELPSGRIAAHRLSVSLGEGEADMCVHNLRLDVSFEHNCLKGIEHIKLSSAGVDAADLTPQSRKYEAKVFVGSMQSRESECEAASVDLSFWDGAEESVLSRLSIPTSGVFRPASGLGQAFGGLPINGEWELSISSRQAIHPEEHAGRLLSWELQVDAKPCVPTPKWEQLPSPPAAFSPRRQHTAIAVDGSIFISGGSAEGRLNDLWRFDVATNEWTELNSAALRDQWPLNGQASHLGPYGLLVYGGLKSHGPLQQGHDIWLWDLSKEDWAHVPVASTDNGLPRTRYLSSMQFLNDVDILYQRHNITDGKGPLALVFGGDGGLLHNAYPDSYSFFDDVWLLSPGGVRVDGAMDRNRGSVCEPRLTVGSMAWNNGCGWHASFGGTPDECSLRDMLTAAWCRGQYQSFYMS
ncbi:hypothetical protein ACHAXT_013311 [Thalassiosira profunda]